MATLEKIALTNREISDLNKMRDSYASERDALDKKLKDGLNALWLEFRSEHNLGDSPFYVDGDVLWIIKDGTNEEKEAFLKMTRYK